MGWPPLAVPRGTPRYPSVLQAVFSWEGLPFAYIIPQNDGIVKSHFAKNTAGKPDFFCYVGERGGKRPAGGQGVGFFRGGGSRQLHGDDLLGGDLHDQLAVGDGQLGLNDLVQIGESGALEGGREGDGEGDGLGVGVEEAEDGGVTLLGLLEGGHADILVIEDDIIRARGEGAVVLGGADGQSGGVGEGVALAVGLGAVVGGVGDHGILQRPRALLLSQRGGQKLQWYLPEESECKK